MASNYFKVRNGTQLTPGTTAGTEAGDLRVDSSDSNKIKFHNGTDEAQLIRADQITDLEFTSSMGLLSTDPQSAIDEVQSNSDSVLQGLNDHVDGSADRHTADMIDVNPSGNLDSTDVQAALEELQGDIDTVSGDIAGKMDAIVSVDNRLPKFDGTGGAVQGTGITVDDSNNVTGVNNLTADGTSQNIGTTNSATSINIGTGTGANTINIGGANSTINMTGTVNSQNVTNLEVSDKLITINNGGAAGSGAVAGVEVEEDGSPTGYVYTSADRNSWQIKAPNTAGVATLTPGASNDDVVLRQASQTLTNKSLTAPVIDAASLTEQGSTPSTPAAGTKKLYAKTDGKVYTLNSAGQEQQVGSGAGGSGKNYLQDLFSGESVTGINRYEDAAAATPVDGTGGSPNITAAALNTSTPLRGTSSQRLSKPASDEQGEGWSIDFTVDRADYEGGKPLFITFSYKTSANYANGDVRLFAYDRDGAALLNVLSLTGDGSLNVATDTSSFTGVFYPNSANNDYRLIFHITSTNANAWDLDIIDLKVGPDVQTPGAIVADLGTEAWADNQANATTSVRLTRVGNRVVAKGLTSFTGAMSGAMTVTIPSAYAPDATEYDLTTRRYNFGLAILRDTGTGWFESHVQYVTANTLNIQVLNAAATNLSVSDTSSTNPFTWANTDTVSWEASWIVSGWSASAALSTTETMLSTVTVKASGNPASASAANIIIWPTENWDEFGAYSTSTGRFTSPRSAKYRVHGVIASANAGVGVNVYIDGVLNSYAGQTDAGGEVTFDATVQANAGQLIDLRPDNTLDVTSGFMYIEEIPNFSIFSVYGNFQHLSATSSIKTPVATNNYHQLTGNSLALTPGTWRLYGQALFNNSGSTPDYASTGLGFYAANGADSSTTPALLSTIPGLTVLSATGADNANFIRLSSTGSGIIPAPSIIVRVTQPATVFAVSYATMTTAANARITVYANAERIQ